MARTQVYRRESGHLGQYEDWWFLDEAEDGAVSVVHEWHYVRVNGLSSDEGAKRYTLEEGLKEAPAKAGDAIRAKLGL